MASVNVTNIVVLNNPSSFTSPLQFEITFECIRELRSDLEWKLTYVGSAESESYDQVLDSVLVGPVPVGINRFVFQTNAPDPATIPRSDLLGVTVVFISCFYQGREFIRVGYYVNTSLPEWEKQQAAARAAVADDDEGMDIDGESEGEGEEEEGEEEEDAELEEGAAAAEGGGEVVMGSPTAAVAAAGASPDAEVTDHDGEMENESPTAPVAAPALELPVNLDFATILRNILADRPRVTRFNISWDEEDFAASAVDAAPVQQAPPPGPELS